MHPFQMAHRLVLCLCCGSLAHPALRQHAVLQYRQMREEIELLEHHADIAADVVGIGALLAERRAVDGDAAFLDFLQMVDAADQRRLAGSGWAAKHDMLAAPDFEVDPLQHLQVAVPLVDAAHGDGFFRNAGLVHGQFPFLSGFRCDFEDRIDFDG
ncbi:hypothetical protein D3C80_797680 [compost metagenome]